MAFLTVVGYILEILIFVFGIIASYLTLKKNPRYLGNIIMSSATFGLAFYSLFILLYDIIATSWAIQIFYRIALSMILAGVIGLFFSMKVLVDSTKWFNLKMNWIPYVGWWAGFTLYMIIDRGFITVLESDEIVNTQMDLIPLAVLIGSVMAVLFYSIFKLNKYGIQRSKGISHDRMKRFAYGLLANIVALFVNIPGQIISDPVIGPIFDVVFFFILLIAVIIITSSFLMLDHEKKTE
ncbi:hypothetical protein NEF87_001753 [Candidatus Lokiarchaeum ossiferum]|uniref:Histidine kinase N-terminal 7TM region domain-containing protein n=1 Tax=Candidatus Lokiarchaeum ossiferum TaxID=2951803 RepID=A0ABY6HQ54_9ARCH|nr:hypothetical protein NEF87_001753 [Candidatus Lokiarchaeum sp. B-35]